MNRSRGSWAFSQWIVNSGGSVIAVVIRLRQCHYRDSKKTTKGNQRVPNDFRKPARFRLASIKVVLLGARICEQSLHVQSQLC